MRTASRSALAVARSQLAETLTASANPEQVALELRNVASLLVTQPALRRALADSARPAQDRAALIAGLLGQRIGAEALGVLQKTVSEVWSSGSDLVDGVELLSVTAELTVADTAGVLSDVEDELFRFSRIVNANPELAEALGDTTTPSSRRMALVGLLLTDKAQASTIRLAELALSGLGGRGVEASLNRLVELTADYRQQWVAYVRSATALTEAQQQRIGAWLERVHEHQISVQARIDESVIGGVVIRIGDEVYDGSIARRLEQARSNLTFR